MGNQYLQAKMYNEDLKREYIEHTITEAMRKKGRTEEEIEENIKNSEKGTQVFYKYVFFKSRAMEEALNKDIYEFDDEEIRLLRLGYPNGSVESVEGVASVLRTYLAYCVDRGYIRINIMQDAVGREEALQYVNKNTQNKRYINRADFEDIINLCENAQDAVCIALPYYGIKGEESSEIVNLKEKDVDFENAKIYIEGRDQWIQVDYFLTELIRDALNEKTYKKNNGQESSSKEKNSPRSRENVISITPYVLRISSRTEFGSIKPINVTSRISRIRHYYGNEFLTTTSIWYSGMLDMAKGIYEEKGDLTLQDWATINERFGYSTSYAHKTRDRLEPLLKNEENKENEEVVLN